MRFLIDENIFPAVSQYLRQLGHNVKSINESGMVKSSDKIVIKTAIEEERTILTFDKHFGNILNYPPAELFGILLIRIHPPLLSDTCDALNRLLKNYNADSFKGRLIVLSKTGYRIR